MEKGRKRDFVFLALKFVRPSSSPLFLSLSLSLSLSHLGRGVDLGKAHVRRSRHVPHDAARALDPDVEQRRRRRRERGVAGARLARSRALAHEGGAGAGHDGPDVGEVDVDLEEKREWSRFFEKEHVRSGKRKTASFLVEGPSPCDKKGRKKEKTLVQEIFPSLLSPVRGS